MRLGNGVIYPFCLLLHLIHSVTVGDIRENKVLTIDFSRSSRANSETDCNLTQGDDQSTVTKVSIRL